MSMTTDQVTTAPILVKMAFGAFMAPFFLFAVTWGNFLVYRSSQIVVILLIMATALRYRHHVRSPSWQAWTIIFVVATSSFASIVDDAFSGSEIDGPLLLKSMMVIISVFLFDCLRGYGFSIFLQSMIPVAVGIVIATTYHFALDPVIVWGRYFFFGLHPNTGGEILFVCMIVVSFSKFIILRLVMGAAIIFLLFLLQSRAAFGGALLVLVGAELCWFTAVDRRNHAPIAIGLGLLVAGVAGATVITLFPELPDHFFALFGDKILLIHDPDRGLETGFVGRVETWGLALEQFAQNPVFGSGMDRSATTAYGMIIHNGYLGMIAEFGMLSFLLYLVIFCGVLRALRIDGLVLISLLACLFVFFFNTRIMNLNVFPLIMWLACLPWASYKGISTVQLSRYRADP